MAKATYLLRKAGELVRERRYQDAVEVYLQATETDPADSRAWFGLGVCLYKVDNLEVAHIALERAQKMGYPRAEEALARVETAERRRSAEGKGAKATMAPDEAQQRAARRPAALREPPPRPAVRPDGEKINLDRYLRVMLIENIETDRQAIAQAIEGTIKDAEVASVEYGLSTSQTMSGSVHYDAAILDWDTAPDAAAGLIQILKIKRPSLQVICLTEDWDPESAVEILEAGADYYLVKQPHFASSIPLILAQSARRDGAILRERDKQAGEGPATVWPEALDALGAPIILVDADLTILQANQAAMKQFKRGEDEFIGRPYCAVFYGREEPPDACPVLQVLEKGEPATDKIRHEMLEKTFTVDAWPVSSYAGKVSGAIALLREEGAEEQAVEELRTREWLYRNLTERANAGVVMVGPDGKVQYANQGLCAMLDQTERELLGQPIENILPPQDQESLRECLQAAVERGESGARLLLQRAEGSTFPAEARVASFSTAEGTYLILTIIGVAELEQAEQELWTEAHKFAMVLDEGVDKLECGVVVLDDQGRVTWTNSLAAELLACEKEELIGGSYMELLAEGLPGRAEDAEGFLDALTGAHQRGEALQGHALRLDGGAPLAYWSTPIGGGSSLVSRVEHFYPATEVIRPAMDLPAGQETLAGVAAAASEMLFTADVEGRITWCNPAAPATAGYTEAQLQGMALPDLVDPEARDKLRGLLQTALERDQQVQRQEVLMARGDGKRYWAELSLVAIRDRHNGSTQVQGVLRDVTEHKMTEAIRAIVSGDSPL